MIQLEVNEELGFKFLGIGIKGDIQFKIFNTKEDEYYGLSRSQLQIIQNAHPHKVKIDLEPFDWAIYKGIKQISHSQNISHKDLWLDNKLLQKYFKKFNGEFDSTTDVDLTKSNYWNYISQLAVKAIKEYPLWKKSRKSNKKILKTTDLADWLKNLGAKTTREIEAIQKIMSDFYEELQ